ncbi:hypothetical protein R3P38DRAFT_1112045 [Favolaschia claudopus]|uniref:Uncharacterized protein n=1 Tax=Favolaschia claudopus TaxID=2862362 RepID=A0AAW0B8Y7_9AGAR
MVSSSYFTFIGAAILASQAAASPIARRGFFGDLFGEINHALEGTMDAIQSIIPSRAPTSEADAAAALNKIFSSGGPTGFIDTTTQLLKAGFAPSRLADLLDVNKTYTTGGNSMVNSPPALPKGAASIFPKAADGDAPFSLSEDVLRQAIFIPDGFTTGKKNPLLIIPGTGQPSFMTYQPNLIPITQKSDFADPVWLNIPGFLLGDAQKSAEYIAYAIGYMSALTGKKVTLIAYSQGNIITQWALTFWPSARKAVSSFVALSPAFRGSILVDAGCVPIKDITGCPPAIHQQRLDSQFVKAMRARGGDSALVPTIAMFSATDEIAQPQVGSDATALLKDPSNVGFTPVRVQDVCKGKLAGGVATHEGMLYHPLTLAMLQDAMTHDGKADVSRVDVNRLCGQAVADGMTLDALVQTEAGIVKAGGAFVEYRPYLQTEPPIASYAA